MGSFVCVFIILFCQPVEYCKATRTVAGWFLLGAAEQNGQVRTQPDRPQTSYLFGLLAPGVVWFTCRCDPQKTDWPAQGLGIGPCRMCSSGRRRSPAVSLEHQWPLKECPPKRSPKCLGPSRTLPAAHHAALSNSCGSCDS